MIGLIVFVLAISALCHQGAGLDDAIREYVTYLMGWYALNTILHLMSLIDVSLQPSDSNTDPLRRNSVRKFNLSFLYTAASVPLFWGASHPEERVLSYCTGAVSFIIILRMSSAFPKAK